MTPTSLWRQLTSGLRALTRRRATDRDIADEVDHFLEQATAELIGRGMSPAEARRTARLEMGDALLVRERVRSYGWENAVEALLIDFRHAARGLRTNPGFAIVAILTLGLGIGASTAIFSAVNPVLFEALPYPNARRITAIRDRAGDGGPLDVTFGTFREIVERSRSFDALAVARPWRPTLTGAAEPDNLEGQRVSADYLRVLGAVPALGRDFDAVDDRPGGARVAILSDALWRRLTGGDSAIIGREIRLDDAPATVIGVMPRGWENVVAPSAQLWSLLQYDPRLPSRDGREWGHHLRMIGRLAPGTGIDAAVAELALIAQDPVPGFARPEWATMNSGLTVIGLQAAVTGDVRPVLLAVLGAVALLLLIASMNVASLLLARAARRRGEFAMRAALGAGRARLLQQMLTESLLLATIGGALGVVIAAAGVRALVAFAPPGLPRIDAIAIDTATLVFAIAITTLVGAAIGFVPALQASRDDPAGALRQASARTAGGHAATRRLLVVAEVALALVLLVGAGLLLRSLERLFAVPPGFDASRVVAMQVRTSGRAFDDAGYTNRYFARALEAARAVPGVESAAFTSQLPLSGDVDGYGVRFEDDNDPEGDHGAYRYAVAPGWFETMDIDVLRGRPLDARDVAGAPAAALINQSFARRIFAGRDPIGEHLRVGSEDSEWLTIVGIVGDVKQSSLSAGVEDAVYMTPENFYFADRARWLVARVRGDGGALIPSIERAVWSVDAAQPIVRAMTMTDLLAASEARRRFALMTFEAFALFALVLAAVGIYGVLSGSVGERMREIGVRSALGASRADILALVLLQGMSMAGLGVTIGLVGAIAASRGLVTLLYGVSRLDPLTYAGVVGMLALVAAGACALPAWRAARVDPTTTLRAQ